MSFELSPIDELFLEFGEELFRICFQPLPNLLLLSSLLLQNLPRRLLFFVLLQLDNALWCTVGFLVPRCLLSTSLPLHTLPFQTVHFCFQLLLLYYLPSSPYHIFASPLVISYFPAATQGLFGIHIRDFIPLLYFRPKLLHLSLRALPHPSLNTSRS